MAALCFDTKERHVCVSYAYADMHGYLGYHSLPQGSRWYKKQNLLTKKSYPVLVQQFWKFGVFRSVSPSGPYSL